MNILNMRRHFLTTLLMTSFLCARSQIHITDVDTLTVFTLGQEQGLSQLNALAMDFDDLGYLWIGTENGLNRYNAYKMQSFMAGENKGELADDHIRDMYFDNDTLWLATNTNSLLAYLPSQNRFLDFKNQLNFTKNPAVKYSTKIYPIGARYLLVGTNGNCLLYNRGSRQFTKVPFPKYANNDYVTSVAPVDDHRFLIGTNNHGLFEFNLQTKTILYDTCLEPLRNLSVTSIYPYSEQKLLIATRSSLYWYDRTEQKFEQALSKNGKIEMITAIQKWNDQYIYLASNNFGYLLDTSLRLTKIIFQDLQKKILSAEVSTIKPDKQGGIWLGTKGRGVFHYHPKFKKFTPYRIQTRDAPRKDFISIFNFLKDGQKLWMATEFGFAQYNFSTKAYKFYRKNCLEYTLAKDDNGTIWAGGFGQGLVKYNDKSDEFEKVDVPLGDKDVIQVTPIDKNYIWVHTWSNGIFELDVHHLTTKRVRLNNRVLVHSRTSYRDRSGRLWVGSDEGIYQITNHQIKHFDNLSNERVFAITEDPSGNIWVGTAKGLNRIDSKNESITIFTKSSGLPNDFIYGVQSDARGNIWSSTNYGLSSYNPKSGRFRNYTEIDGLQNNEFNGKASYKDPSGNLYFGGMNGFNYFNPQEIFTNKKIGKTVIEDVLVFGKSIGKNTPYLKQLILTHEQNVISFEYTALNYLWPEKNLYQFKLEGFDKDWRLVTDFRNTTYTNLDPGTYTFKVRSSNNDGVWGEPTSLEIVIKGPWYQSLWFKILAGAVLLLFILGISTYRNYQQKIVNRRLQKMVEERTSALQKSNKELNESLELSEKQKENITFLMRELNHRVKNNLQIITSLIDIQDLSITNPKAKMKLKLLQSRIFTVSRIHDILTNTQEKEEIPIDSFLTQLAREIIEFSGKRIRLRTSMISVKYPVVKLTYLGLILNELITNSIKHAFDQQTEPKITLLLTEQNDQLHFTYKDNGSGFNSTMSHGTEKMGVNLMIFLARELSGTFDLKHTLSAIVHLTFSKK